MSAQIAHLSPQQARARLAPWPNRAAPISAPEYQERIENARRRMREPNSLM